MPLIKDSSHAVTFQGMQTNDGVARKKAAPGFKFDNLVEKEAISSLYELSKHDQLQGAAWVANSER